MKTCSSCKETKSFDSYHNRGGSRKNEYQAKCKDCRNLESREYKRKTSNLVKRWKLRKGCANCGFKARHSVQLDIDHIIPKRKKTKDRQAINTGWSRKRLKEELAKCQVLCANCHRLKTYEDGTMFKSE